MFCFYLWRLEVVGREKHHCKVNCLILTVLRNGETNLKRKFWSAVQILHRDKFLWKLKQTIMYKGHQLCWGGAQANVFVPGSWGRLPASGHLGYVGFMSFQHGACKAEHPREWESWALDSRCTQAPWALHSRAVALLWSQGTCQCLSPQD